MMVAVDVGVGAWEAAQAAVRPAAEDVVAVVAVVGREVVVAEDVVARTLKEADSLRTLGMVSLAALAEFLPTVCVRPRMVHVVALDDHARQRFVLRVDGRVVVHSPAVLVHAPPAADVAALDHHVVRAFAQHDAVNPRRPQRQAAEDDVGGPDLDALVGLVRGVDRGRGGTRAVRVEDVPGGRARLVHDRASCRSCRPPARFGRWETSRSRWRPSTRPTAHRRPAPDGLRTSCRFAVGRCCRGIRRCACRTTRGVLPATLARRPHDSVRGRAYLPRRRPVSSTDRCSRTCRRREASPTEACR